MEDQEWEFDADRLAEEIAAEMAYEFKQMMMERREEMYG